MEESDRSESGLESIHDLYKEYGRVASMIVGLYAVGVIDYPTLGKAAKINVALRNVIADATRELEKLANPIGQ